MAEHFQIGDKIEGRWEIQQTLEGRTCNVFIVFDHQLDRSFAAKAIQEKSISPVSTKNFSDAAQAWIGLGFHPNIAKAHFVETIGERQFLFTDYVSSGSLATGICHELPYALRLGINICDGMCFATAKGVAVHGNIKPSNCLVTRDGILKLTDFGMAGLLDTPSEGGVAPGLLATRMFKKIATGMFKSRNQPPADQSVPTTSDNIHLAPELRSPPHRRTVKSDIYSFGVLLFELITGHAPQLNGSATHAPSPSTKFEELNKIVVACMAKDPAERPESFTAVRDQLAAVYKTLTLESIFTVQSGPELDVFEAARESSNLRDMGFYEKATKHFGEALNRCPQQPSVFLSLGKQLRGISNWSDAIVCYERALDIEPQNAAAIAGKGIALLQLGKINEASDFSDRAIELAPENDEALVLMGMIWTTIGRAQAAMDYFEKALTANPSSAEAWFQKGKLLKVDQPGESLDSFERVITLNPRHADAWIMKGEVMGQLQRPRDEVSCYDQALAINPENPEAWYRKGMALCSGLNRYQDAMVCLQEAQKLGHPQAADGIATCKPLLEFTEKTNTYARIKRPEV